MDDIPPEFRNLFEATPAPQQTPKRLRKCQREARFILDHPGCFRPPERTVPAVETQTDSLNQELNPQ